MGSEEQEEIYEQQLERLQECEHGDEEILEARRLVELAREMDDLDKKYEARIELIKACMFGGATEEAIVAFGWCRATFDANPGRFYEDYFLWVYKWILGSISRFPSISRENIEKMADDLERRYQAQDGGAEAILKLRCGLARSMGDRKKFEGLYERWKKEEPDFHSDCQACYINWDVGFLLFQKKYKEAISRAEPILTGEYFCASVPHGTYPDLLIPMCQNGQAERARNIFPRSYRLIARNKDYLDDIGGLIRYLLFVGENSRALRVFEKHYPDYFEVVEPSARFDFILAGWALMARLEKEGPRERPIKLPPKHGDHNPEKPVDISELKNHFKQEALEFARAFNARNGNDRFHMVIKDNLGELGLNEF